MAASPQRIELTISTRTILRILFTTVAFILGGIIFYLLIDQLAWVAISFFLALALALRP